MGVWPSITKDRQTHDNAICRVLAGLGQALGGDIVYQPGLRLPTPTATVTVDVGGSRMRVSFARKDAERMAASYFDLTRDYVVPPELIGAAFENAAAGLASQLENVLGSGFTVIDVAETDDQPVDALGFVGQTGPMDGIMFAIAADVDAPPLSSPLTPARPAGRWPIRIPVRIGSKILDAATYAGLSEMDILVLGQAVPGENLAATLSLNAYTALAGTLAENQFTIESILKGQNIMSEDEDQAKPDEPLNEAEPEAAAEAATTEGAEDALPDDTKEDTLLSDASIGALPVRLDFDIGEVELSYAELAALTPGQSFDLGKAPDQAVAIRVAGRKVGIGELIEIDGRIGVRIRTLAK